jgi:hypothetical protein
MYSSTMTAIAMPIAMHTTVSLSVQLLEGLVLLVVLVAAGSFIGHEYLNRRSNRRNWE